jgi:hypothetical protein
LLQESESQAANASAELEKVQGEVTKAQQQLVECRSFAAKAIGKVVVEFAGISLEKLPSKEDLAKNFQHLISAEIFSCNWYLERYPDVAGSEMNPLIHYLIHGAEEGREPFDLGPQSNQKHVEVEDV